MVESTQVPTDTVIVADVCQCVVEEIVAPAGQTEALATTPINMLAGA